jgi:hypothetical protein
MNKLPLLEKFLEDLRQTRESAPPECWSAFAKYRNKWPSQYRPAHYWDLDFSEHLTRHVLNAVDAFMCETLDFGSPGQWTDLSRRKGNFELASGYRQGADGELVPMEPPEKYAPREYRFVIAWNGLEYDYWLHFLGLREDLGPAPYLMDATLFLWLEWKNRMNLASGDTHPPEQESVEVWAKLLAKVFQLEGATAAGG